MPSLPAWSHLHMNKFLCSCVHSTKTHPLQLGLYRAGYFSSYLSCCSHVSGLLSQEPSPSSSNTSSLSTGPLYMPFLLPGLSSSHASIQVAINHYSIFTEGISFMARVPTVSLHLFGDNLVNSVSPMRTSSAELGLCLCWFSSYSSTSHDRWHSVTKS